MADPTILSIQDILEGDLFELVGLSQLSTEEKQEFIDLMIKTVYARVFLQITEFLSAEDQKAFAEVPGDELMSFLKNHDIDLSTMLAEESLRYRQEIIDVYLTAHSPYASSEVPMIAQPV